MTHSPIKFERSGQAKNVVRTNVLEMIEPHPAYFADLKELYHGYKGITLENYLVGDAPRQLERHFVLEEPRAYFLLPARGWASMTRERLSSVFAGARNEKFAFDAERDLPSCSVRVRRLDHVLKEQKINEIDLPVADVEGFEISV